MADKSSELLYTNQESAWAAKMAYCKKRQIFQMCLVRNYTIPNLLFVTNLLIQEMASQVEPSVSEQLVIETVNSSSVECIWTE